MTTDTSHLSTEERIAIIRDFVPRLRTQVAGFSPEELTTAYNAPEWTIAQNVHHLVDSHINSYCRFKLILTEESPVMLRPYNQDLWAALPDASDALIEDSLLILEGMHARWARMLNNITDWQPYGHNAEYQRDYSLDDLLTTYSTHCNLHIKQIQAVIDKMPSKA